MSPQQEGLDSKHREQLGQAPGHDFQHPKSLLKPGMREISACGPSGLTDSPQEASILLAKGPIVFLDLLQVAEGLLAHLCLDLGNMSDVPSASRPSFPAPACHPSIIATRGPSWVPPTPNKVFSVPLPGLFVCHPYVVGLPTTYILKLKPLPTPLGGSHGSLWGRSWSSKQATDLFQVNCMAKGQGRDSSHKLCLLP